MATRTALIPQTRYGKLLLTVLVLFFVGGCARLNGTFMEGLLGKENDLIKFAYNAAENLTSRAYPPLVPMNPEMPILTTTFVDNNDLTRTSQFGRIVQEHMASRLVQMGYSVKEIKLANSLEIQERKGETILSRDLRKLSASTQAQAILVGTVSSINNIMYISARLINPQTSTIIASTDYRLLMDYQLMAMTGVNQAPHADPEMIAPPPRPRVNSWFNKPTSH